MVLPDRLCEVSCCSHTALAALLWTFCAFFQGSCASKEGNTLLCQRSVK